MERTQFTFYASFYEAISRIRKKADRAEAYDVVVRYALTGEEPDMDSISDAAAIVFQVAKPNLDSSRRKAEAGQKGGKSKPEAREAPKQTRSKPEASPKQVQEKEQVQVQDKEQMLKDTSGESTDPKKATAKQEAFDRFWFAYPKKVGKGDARKAFDKVRVDVDILIAALEQQKRSDQWTRDGGRFIPNPSTWLNQGRWEDELSAGGDPQVQHHGAEMSPMMKAAVAKIMAEEGVE